MRKLSLSALLLSLIVALSLAVPALAEDQPSTPVTIPQVEGGELVILHTNDVHSHIDGDIRYSHVAGLKDHLEVLGAHVILVDSGDHIQGTAYGSTDSGETIIELMNAAGYDLATLGNHEFDYGMEGAMDAVQWADFPYLSCNFYHEKDGIPGAAVLAPFEIIQCGDQKLAFVGITTPETFTSSTPAYFQNENGAYIYGISGGEDGQALYAAVQTAVDAALTQDALVVAVGHLGVEDASSPWTSRDVLDNTSGISLFLDGHSHTQMASQPSAQTGLDEALVQTGEYLGYIGMTVIRDQTAGAEFYLIGPDELSAMGVEQDAQVKSMEDAWITEVNDQLDQVVGYTSITLDNYAPDGTRLVRTQVTNSGAFSADALYYLFHEMGMDVDVAVMNGGGIRNQAITGQLTYKDMKEIHPFGNVACLITVTGQQLLDALEWGARDLGNAENGALLHPSGLIYSVDTSIPSSVQADERGVWIGGPTGEYRVKDVMLVTPDQELIPLDVNAKYNLAGYNYTLRDLGDGFAMFDGAVNVLDYVMEDYMVLANYLQSFPVVDGLPTLEAKSQTSAAFPDYSDVNMPGRLTPIAAAAETPIPAPPEVPIPRTYVVTPGDCLWNIAARQLGAGPLWRQLYQANASILVNPALIYPGQVLILP